MNQVIVIYEQVEHENMGEKELIKYKKIKISQLKSQHNTKLRCFIVKS